MKDRLFEIWFSLRCGIANKEFQPLLETYGTPYELFNADEAELDKLPCSQTLKNRLADKSLREATRIMEYCKENRIGILFWQDEQYPASLRPLHDPPVLLYYKGKLPDLSRRLCISVVGTRSMSEYGKRMAYKIGYELGAVGTVVVSGMALGNDSVAAAGAIAAGGQTVALLGCGIDTVYPREHDKLFEEILKKGAIMTEYPPATPPEGRNFPVRNRLISGLSRGTVVIEGDLKSGSMITAKTAILQGRDIYAFPGNVGETNSSGTNQLISDGATIVLKARDLLENYTFLYRDALDMARLLKAETRSEPDDELLARLGVSVRTVTPRKSESPTAPLPAVQGKNRAPRSRASAEPAKSPETRSHSTPKSATPAGKPTPSVPARGDASEQILQKLTDTQKRIFAALPLDHAVPIDHITREGFSVGEVMAAMTILEIHGLTVTLPGGLYARK